MLQPSINDNEHEFKATFLLLPSSIFGKMNQWLGWSVTEGRVILIIIIAYIFYASFWFLGPLFFSSSSFSLFFFSFFVSRYLFEMCVQTASKHVMVLGVNLCEAHWSASTTISILHSNQNDFRHHPMCVSIIYECITNRKVCMRTCACAWHSWEWIDRDVYMLNMRIP